LIITRNHVRSAIDFVEIAEESMHNVVTHIGATAQSTVGDLILTVLKAAYPEQVSHSDMLRRVYKRVKNAAEFKEIIETLIESRRVIEEGSQKGIFYTFIK